MNKREQLIENRKLPYDYCWWCSKKLMRITRGPNKGLYSFGAMMVDGIVRYVHKQCVEKVLDFYKNRVKHS